MTRAAAPARRRTPVVTTAARPRRALDPRPGDRDGGDQLLGLGHPHAAALDLRRTFKNVPDDEHDDAVRQTRLVSAWLTHAGNRQLVPSTAHLAGYAVDHTHLTSAALAADWYATHGPRLLLELSARGSTSSEILVRQAVRGVDAARILTRTEIADRAGITRTASDTWLKGGTDA